MKPPAFAYALADSIDEVCELLHDDPDAKVLAGGQSLVPLLSMRLAQPSALVDIQRIDDLRRVAAEDGHVRIGAMTTHSRLEKPEQADGAVAMLKEAARHIAHPQIRNRGTLGGSLAHADPSGEWPVVMLALDATVVARSVLGERMVPVDDLFTGPFMTTLAFDEVITEVLVPVTDRAWSFQELARRVGDFGLGLVAVTLELAGDTCLSARIAVGGATTLACRAEVAESQLEGTVLSDDAIVGAADSAAANLAMTSDIHGSAEYRRQLVRVLVERALRDARQKAI